MTRFNELSREELLKAKAEIDCLLTSRRQSIVEASRARVIEIFGSDGLAKAGELISLAASRGYTVDFKKVSQ